MNRFIKIMIKIILGISLLWLLFLVWAHMLFSGVFDKKYTREELTENFRKHEKDFSDLVTFFRNGIPKKATYTVSFCTSNRGQINVSIKPTVIDPTSKSRYATNLERDSAQLDTILSTLGWTQETVKALADQLIKINNNCIRTTTTYGEPIVIYPDQNGWGSYDYCVVELPFLDSLRKRYAQPISNSDLGQRIFLRYSTAL
jgi:hypothetical protein